MEKSNMSDLKMNQKMFCSISKIVKDEIFYSFENKSILITGGTGFIIRYFVYTIICRNDLYNSNIKLYIQVRDLEKAKKIYGELFYRQDLVFICRDICNGIEVTEKVDYIIHSAGQSNPVAIQADPVGTFNANVIGTNNVLEFAKEKEVESVLYMSSYMVYGGTINKENVMQPYAVPVDFQKFQNCYAQSKRSGEMLCACYNEQHGIHTKIIRPSFVYGSSDESDKRVWSEIIRCVAQGKDVVLNSNGVCFRAVVYVMDVIMAMLYVIIKGEDCIGYNVESGITTIREFAQIAVELSNGVSHLIFKNQEDSNVEETKLRIPEEMEYNDYMILKELGWKPMWELREAIRDAIMVEKEGQK